MGQDNSSAHIRVRRYSGSARINHWIVAISFVLLMLSGLSLFYPTFYPLSVLFGGLQTARSSSVPMSSPMLGSFRPSSCCRCRLRGVLNRPSVAAR